MALVWCRGGLTRAEEVPTTRSLRKRRNSSEHLSRDVRYEANFIVMSFKIIPNGDEVTASYLSRIFKTRSGHFAPRSHLSHMVGTGVVPHHL